MSAVDSTRAVEYQWIVWRVFGMNPPEDESFWARHYKTYSIVINIYSNIWAPIALYIKCMISTTLSEFCETFYVVALVIVHQMKFVNSWRVLHRLKETHKILHRLDARLQAVEERNIIRDYISQSKRAFLILLRLLLLILSTAALYAISSPDRELPFPGWFPWSWEISTSIYFLTIIVEIIGLLTLALMALVNDTYPVAYLTMVAGHYKALSFRISLLGYSNISPGGAYYQLIDCIEDHKIILELLQTIKDSLSFACFYQFVSTATASCSLAFFLIYVRLSFYKFVYLFLMMLAIIFETLVLCYSAEKVIHEAEQMSLAIYRCNWQNQSLTFQRDIILMLKRSQSPVAILAARIMPVRMAFLVVVIKGAYSMFTLLNEVTSTK